MKLVYLSLKFKLPLCVVAVFCVSSSYCCSWIVCCCYGGELSKVSRVEHRVDHGLLLRLLRLVIMSVVAMSMMMMLLLLLLPWIRSDDHALSAPDGSLLRGRGGGGRRIQVLPHL